MKYRVRSLGALPAIALSLTPATSRADDTIQAEQKAAAQVLFEEGRTLVEEGRFDEACPKLAESQRLDPGIGTMLWLGECYENTHHSASAWVTFKEAAGAAAARHDDRERVARERAAQLESKLTRLTISVEAEQAHLEVRRDGILLGSAEWGVSIPVDPGAHTVSAEAPGRRRWSTTVELPPGPDAIEVTIPALPPADEPAVENVAPRPATAARPRSNDAGSGLRIAGASIGSAGLVAVAAGVFFGLRAKTAYDDSNTSGHCRADNECDPTGLKDRSDAFSMATAATIAIGAGAAAVVGGAVMFFAAPHHDTSLAVAPTARGVTLRYQIDW
jgi:serine/threonine-protein kinase